MTAIALQRPREIQVHKPVRIILTGGFLGAGKTTALGTLAKSLIEEGLTVGFVTNDQAANLVDTAIVTELGLPVAEVAGGCFCCRFTDLLDATQAVLAHQPDVLLFEPVGSCTDMAATVLNPLKRFYGDVFALAPFSVLVDPVRVQEAVLHEVAGAFADEVTYIFRKQLEEADLIVLNKIDTLTAEETERLAHALEIQYQKPVVKLSALCGDGIELWKQALLAETPSGKHVLRDLDYDLYAKGEAVLGWLNATVALHGNPTLDARQFVEAFLQELQSGCAAQSAEIAHLKLTLSTKNVVLRAHLTATAQTPVVMGEPTAKLENATLIINARIQMEPGRLGGLVVQAIQQAATRASASAEIVTIQSFSPAYPRPPYRFSASE
jgi:G3E family GTPase